MQSFRNNVQLLGNLGKDVELKKLDAGKSVVNFSLATNEYYKNSEGEKVEETQWHNIVAWGKLAENMEQILSKGSRVLIKGKLMQSSYEDKNGEKKYVTKVQAQDFLNITKKAEMPF